MKYEDIKTYNERCEKFHGIVTNERLMEVLIEEVEELRGLIEAKSKPLTNEEITALVLEWWCPTMVTAKDRKFVRAIERAHGIGSEE